LLSLAPSVNTLSPLRQSVPKGNSSYLHSFSSSISTDPISYGTFEGNICLAPNAGYSVQPSTTEAPIFVTLTVPELSAGGPSTTETIDGHTDTGYTDLTATKTETLTVSNLYCPPPLSAYGEVCVTANDTASFTAAKSATMSFNSTATVAYTAAAAAATTSDVKTADTATTTRGTTNPFGISLGGPATTITSGGSTFTRYSASGGVLNSLTSSATAATTVAPYKGDAAGRVGGGAIGGMGAAGAAALWML